MSTPAWIAAATETLCNGALALDPESRERLGALGDKVIAVDVLGLGLRLYFLPNSNGVVVLSHYEGEPDTELRGAPLALLRLLVSDAPAEELFAGGIELRGDTTAGETFQNILRTLDLDWEGLLARIVGDELAHQAGRLARSAGAQTRHMERTLEADLGEYLQEEAQLLVGRRRLDGFLDAVDRLRDEGERLEARVRRLEAALTGKG